MDSISIGLWVSGGMLVMVLLGMRVAFCCRYGGLCRPRLAEVERV